MQYSNKIKALAVFIYLESVSLRNIGKILKIPYQTISKWIKNKGLKVKQTVENIKTIEVLEIDKIVDFVDTNLRIFFFTKLGLMSKIDQNGCI